MIDLAPNHKHGFQVANPILLAGGMIGYGEALHPQLGVDQLGGVVVGPITLNSRAGATGRRVAETNGGFILETGLQNRGLAAVLKQFAKLWPRLGCPVVAQVADNQPSALAKVAAQLTSALELSGLELLLPRNADIELTRALIRTLTRHSDLPIWVKLPLERSATLAPVAVEAGAVALVVGQPLLGAAFPMQQPNVSDQPVTGSLYGPLVFAPMLAALLGVTKLNLSCALIACSGVHTLTQVQQLLAAGAQAVQIDSAVWVEPGLPERLVAGLKGTPP
ncbi:MAG: hypothetical protein U0350_37995 [Caldilineaceae bacterium]